MNGGTNHTLGVSANGCDHHTEFLTVWLIPTNPDVISLAMKYAPICRELWQQSWKIVSSSELL